MAWRLLPVVADTAAAAVSAADTDYQDTGQELRPSC
jgi:hypothetical protein